MQPEPADVGQSQQQIPGLKAYVGTKILFAKPMTEDEWKLFKGHTKEEIKNWESQGDGYLVIYDNGYQSWSPKDVFETHYRLLTESEMYVARVGNT